MKIKNSIAISDSGFVFNPSSGESFSVNPIGSEIINMIKEEKSFDKIKNQVLKDYETDEITFEKDYFDFASVLKRYLLIEDNE
jgi:hypothetical protein